MSAIYSIDTSGPTLGTPTLQSSPGADALPDGYRSFFPASIGGNTVLLALDKSGQSLDSYFLSGADPWIADSKVNASLEGGPWDQINGFVLGNIPYLLAYRADTGNIGFFAINDNLSLSAPYIFTSSHTTPSAGFTTVAPYVSLGAQYVLGYDNSTGRVENISVSVIPTSGGGVPPLLAANVWYHLWAKGWTNFALFQLGGANFFFKINKLKLNVNIDHMLDNPALGSIEVGSQLQDKMLDAAAITNSAIIPWANGEPYLITYVAPSGNSAVYRIQSDCQGWTPVWMGVAVAGASQVVPYRAGDKTCVLIYAGQS
jgi:hypothetical protein